MPAFAAINLDPEDVVTEEVDNTKEIQVDDALKQFQTALKLHAQGPRFFDEAADAYNALFECDIFKFPESKTEYERTEAHTEISNPLEPTFLPGLDATGADGDNLAATLLQAYYLSYKNHGQYILDGIKHRARAASPADRALVFDGPEVVGSAKQAVEDFTAALDRDPSDAELWRRTARVAAFLRSTRINRYALEAAIELDDDPAVMEVDPPSLAEGFAGEQLKRQLEVLNDQMALTHPIMIPFITKDIPSMLQPYVDPAPFLPNPTRRLATSNFGIQDAGPRRLVVDAKTSTWTDFGMALLCSLAENGLAGGAISIQLPDTSDDEAAEQMEIDRQLQIAEETATQVPSPEEVKERKTSIAEPPTSPEVPHKERSISLPSRKRSQSMAGLPEPQEEENADTKRSKRVRRRDTVAEDIIDPATLLATQLQPYQAADQNLFQTTKNILENLGVTDLVTLGRISEVLDTCATEDRTARVTNPPTIDLRDCMISFDEDNAKIFLNKKETPQPGLSTFHEHTKTGSQRAFDPPAFDENQDLRSLVRRVNREWLTLDDVAYEWVKAISKTYAKSKWSDRTKTTVVHIISRFDKPLYERITYELKQHDNQLTNKTASELDPLVETIFELHLDVYERITNPTSTVEQSVRVETKGRLDRWFDFAAQIRRAQQGEVNDLVRRFVWAAVFTATLAEGVTRDHILALWHNLREYLAEVDHADINLPNNVVMPEVSASAADREISKLTTMDFFLGLFQEEIGEPVGVIDTLEPVLNPDSVFIETHAISEDAEDGEDGDDVNGDSHGEEPRNTSRKPIGEIANQGLRDLWKFLENSSTDLRLFLWTRLAGAYATIKYTTKEFSCYLRGIEMIVADFELDAYNNTPPELRRTLFVTMLKAADDLLVQALSLALNDNSAFDIIDEAHIKSTTAALAKLSCLLHVAFMFEDEVKIGMAQAPTNSSTFSSFFNKLREMQVRTWSLQYTMFKVGVNLNPEVFPKPENDLADYLAGVHQVLGLRKCCKGSNKVFLKMMRIELLKQVNIENWEDYLGQVLYDLYGIKLGVGMWEVQDHGCPPEKLERRPAMALVEKITTLANRMSVKDLLKSDLRTAIDHVQQAIGSPKSTPQMIHNLRNYMEYMRKPIHPLRLYQAMTGKVSLDAVTVNTPESVLARHGWFFLLGMIAFTKFKAVDLNRRQTPGATDDLRITATYLRLQLQFTPNHWKAWFRLAESLDYEVEETVLWTADKMNKDREDMVKFQRQSIHCYTLALSYSRSWEADSPAAASSAEDDQVLSEMYYGFGMRLYASSREPFAMEPFQHSDQERFFINMDPGQAPGTFRKILHHEMTDYKVWKFAASLFKRAMAGKPKDWKNPYMYAKCVWKMYQKPTDALDSSDRRTQPTVQAVIAALERSVQVVRAQQKPRQDPILEPHYKIISVVYKLVMREDLGQQEAADILQRQPFAPQRGEAVTIENKDEWEAYVLKALRAIRDKDKSNWQHRLIMRHACILFDLEPSHSGDTNSDLVIDIEHENDSSNLDPAKAAFSVLRENMFTKTMVMNVWKCDAERPGRHHVYTSQYVRYMFRLLSVMNDRINMEALLRRLRKKGADFYHFTDLWYQCASAYLTLIRHSYQIPAAADDAFKHLSPEEFDIVAERINDWVIGPEATDHPALGALKDSIELKKLNGGLMKSSLIDDLIADCYSHLYTEISPRLPGPDPAQVVEERHKARDAQLQANDLKSALTSGLLLPPAEIKNNTPIGSGRASAEPPEKHEGAPRGRRSAVVRKPDILRKAEQAVTRALEGPPKAAGANGKTRLGSLSGGKNNTPSGDAEDVEEHAGSDDVEMKDGDAGGAGKDGGPDAASSSPPGSIHDSADDESDLSDVPPDYEDDAPPALLFPNLRRSMETGITSARQSDGDDSSGAEEEEEEEEEGEGEGDEEEEGGEEEAGEQEDADMEGQEDGDQRLVSTEVQDDEEEEEAGAGEPQTIED